MEKMYVLVREDLDEVYRFIQAGHAIAEFILKHEDIARKWNNQYLIYVKVKDELRIKDWEYKLKLNDVEFEKFLEPDIENQLTAIAFVSDDKFTEKLQLIK
ncbi:hypothetical protein M0R19_08265 [Candidatus Pacearchaeota archaeon]|jgi:hypothetical protein|nr:hypothetical protein [bacterium]MCK9597151.1 hypothetical protein [Candidatus Pacearchaeota archaeon]